MKTFKYISRIAASMALCSLALVACNDDKEYDFPGDPNNKVYTADHSTETKIVQTPVGTFGGLNVAIPAVCKAPAEGDITVTFEINNGLIDAYNAENETNYKPMPAEALVLNNQSVVIPSGELKSDSVFTINFTDDADILATLEDLDGYLIPVSIKSISGGNAKQAVSVPSISYIVVGVGFDVTDPNANEGNRKGSLVDDRSGWTVNLLQGSQSGDASAWFDGDVNNSCLFEDPDYASVVVDLGRVYSFDGIVGSYKMYGWYDCGVFKEKMKVALSSDNVQWMEVFECDNNSWLGQKFVGFYGPMNARYIRISTPNPYAGTSYAQWYNAEIECADFNIYATN